MPRYTFIQSQGDETPDLADCSLEILRDHDDAIAFARSLAEVSGRSDKASVAVGCGEGDDIEWLGAWDAEPGRPAVWSRDD